MTLPDSLPTVEVDDLPGPDFTTYVDIESAERLKEPRAQPLSSEDFRLEGPFEIKHGDRKTAARGLKCRAYRGAYWSITLRSNAKNVRESSDDYSGKMVKALLEYAETADAAAAKEAVAAGTEPHKSEKRETQDCLGYCPVGHRSDLFKKEEQLDGSKAGVFLNDIYQVCSKLNEILLAGRAVTPTGLIAVTGATDSSKSLIARGLIFLYLEAAAEQALKKRLRRPHLVTFEDPIEEFYIKDPATKSPPKDLGALNKLLDAVYIDYTPREKNADTDQLAHALKDAKRQTPTVFFVGETRDPGDWVELLQFAGSGHLVITTSHASSVVEAMTQIFSQKQTKTPAQRSEIARRILGIVNLRSLHPASDNIRSNVRVLLPAVWKSTSQSINNLVADGLSSILPALGREPEICYYGRTYFARELIANSTRAFRRCDDRPHLEKEIKRKAMEWDIGGV